MSSSYPKSIETMFGTAKILCRYVAEATDNKFQIQAYQAGELAPSRQALDAVSSGSVDCAYTPLAFLCRTRTPCSAFGTGMPFGLMQPTPAVLVDLRRRRRDRQCRAQAVQRRRHPCRPSPARRWARGSRRRSTRSRISRVCVGASAALGGPVLERVGAGAPVYSACRRLRGARARERSMPPNSSAPMTTKNWVSPKVAKYNYHPCWWESGGMVHLIVNQERWNALPKPYQAIVDTRLRLRQAPGCSPSTTRSMRLR